MTNYESDSSSEGGNGYATTDVVLGYASIESSGDEISHIGGHPVWLDPKSRPPASLVKCKVCSDHMSLLLQLNADLQQHFPNDQRRLQIWTCRKKACARKAGSIRVIREVRKDQGRRGKKVEENAVAPQKSSTDLGNALFGASMPASSSNANPFSSTGDSPNTSSNPFGGLALPSSLAAKAPQLPSSAVDPPTETFAQKLKLNTTETPSSAKSDPWPPTEVFPEPYPFFYLDAYPEELDLAPESGPTLAAESSRAQYDLEDNSSSSADKDAFESDLDKTFQKFSDIVAQNPEQVLRYEFKGQPLLYSGSDGVASRFVVPHGKAGAVKGVPRCEKCGSQRVFEMQLTPYLIYEVEKDEATDIDSGMEWGSVIVGTCANNCGDEGSVAFREEWSGVQWEERVVRR